jgi:tripartite ATP-independent transporter DctM subunit
MDWVSALLLMLGMICAFMALGLPVAFAFLLANIAGAILFMAASGGIDAALVSLVRGSMASIGNFNLAPIPLFLLMGEILLQTGVAFRAVDAIDRLISRVPGRLSVVAVTGGTVFSALSGSTIATTAMLGQALLPDMLKRGYHPSMAMGPIMAIGGVDMLIPPSALTVLLATLASGVSKVKISVADLLIAGILPGLLMAGAFLAYIVLRCRMDPALAPAYEVRRIALRERWLPFFKYVVPLFLIFIVVMGSMFAGIASPTDAAALGGLATVLLALAYRALRPATLLACLKSTAVVTTMIFFIIAASTTFAQILAFSGATDGALAALAKLGLGKYAAIFAMIGVLLVLGCFMDQVSMMLLTLPFFMPLANELLGPSTFDHVWFGVILLIALQIGLLTPPFGLLLFVMKGVAPPSITLPQVWAAATPFTLIVMAVLLAIVFLPWLATALVRLM